jgi:UDP-N-acetylmuramoyl-L-alanyl-D-glutamate--2,6-diaminopimelate ligase
MIKKIISNIIGHEGVLFTHRVRSRLAAALYRYPSSNLKVIGITGTNGKTTTAFMVAEILERAGFTVGMATTVEFRVAGQRRPNTTKMTTISPFALQKFLRQLVDVKCQFAVLEVTSHAIIQERIFGIPFDTAVFTNLTHDHLDYHQSFAAYRDAKLQLFAHHPRLAVINLDDKSSGHFLALPAIRQISYGLGTRAAVRAERVRFTRDGTSCQIVTPVGEGMLTLPLPGTFNVYNALAAVSVGIGHDLPLPGITRALAAFPGVPGRMERIDCGQPFSVFVDYAHTPDAFQQIYSALVPATSGRILHVFGATGDRDRTKRPILGAIAAKYADFLFITDEDPYSEDPWKIIETVADGVVRAGRSAKDRRKEGEQFWKILDRREAIAKAFSMARPGDVVLLTGKGAENVMVVGPRRVPWDDRQVAREELSKLGYKD